MEIIKPSMSSIIIIVYYGLNSYISCNIKPIHKVFLAAYWKKFTKKDWKLREGKYIPRKGKEKQSRHEWQP